MPEELLRENWFSRCCLYYNYYQRTSVVSCTDLDRTGIFIVFTDESVICLDVSVTVSCALDLCIRNPLQ